MSSEEIPAAASSEGRGRERSGVEAAGRGWREDLASESECCILPPGRGSKRGSSASRGAYFPASLWREVRRHSWTEMTRFS
jgi:hypothetical protein